MRMLLYKLGAVVILQRTQTTSKFLLSVYVFVGVVYWNIFNFIVYSYFTFSVGSIKRTNGHIMCRRSNNNNYIQLIELLCIVFFLCPVTFLLTSFEITNTPEMKNELISAPSIAYSIRRCCSLLIAG